MQFALLPQACGIVHCRLRVVNRTWTDDHGEPVIVSMQDALYAGARQRDRVRRRLGAWMLLSDLLWRTEFAKVANTQIVGTDVHNSTPGKISGGKKKPPEVAVFSDLSGSFFSGRTRSFRHWLWTVEIKPEPVAGGFHAPIDNTVFAAQAISGVVDRVLRRTPIASGAPAT
jgi:hypothetical protein